MGSRADEDAAIFATARNLRGRFEGVDELAREYVYKRKTAAEFREVALEKMGIVTAARPTLDVPVGCSLLRALHSLQKNGGSLSGPEREVDQECRHILGMAPQGSFFMPLNTLARSVPLNTYARGYVAGTDTLGGHLIGNHTDRFIDLLRAKSVVFGAGAESASLGAPLLLPKATAGPTMTWTTGTTAAELSSGSFDRLTLSPQIVTAFCQVDNQLIGSAGGGTADMQTADAIAVNAMLAGLGSDIDRVSVIGDSDNDEPEGLVNYSGIPTHTLGGNGATITYPFLTTLAESGEAAGASMEDSVWLAHPGQLKNMRVLSRATGSDPILGESGTVCRAPVRSASFLPTGLTMGSSTLCTEIVLCQPSDLLVGFFNYGIADILYNPYTSSVNGVTQLVLRVFVGTAWRHIEGQALGLGVLS